MARPANRRAIATICETAPGRRPVSRCAVRNRRAARRHRLKPPRPDRSQRQQQGAQDLRRLQIPALRPPVVEQVPGPGRRAKAVRVGGADLAQPAQQTGASVEAEEFVCRAMLKRRGKTFRRNPRQRRGIGPPWVRLDRRKTAPAASPAGLPPPAPRTAPTPDRSRPRGSATPARPRHRAIPRRPRDRSAPGARRHRPRRRPAQRGRRRRRKSAASGCGRAPRDRDNAGG